MAAFQFVGHSGMKWMEQMMLIEKNSNESDAGFESAERAVSSEQLFGASKVVKIEHGSSVYRLIRTRQGKLILNK